MSAFLRILNRFAVVAVVATTLPPAAAQEAVTTMGPDIATERAAPPPVAAIEGNAERKLKPFGFNLFTGCFRSERESGLNPDYLIVPGDRVTAAVPAAAVSTTNSPLRIRPPGRTIVPWANVQPRRRMGTIDPSPAYT